MENPTSMYVKRRVVFFLCGFDRRGEEFYRQQYAEQAALQQRVNGCEYDVSELDRRDEKMPTWQVKAVYPEEQKVHTSYHWLHWSDLMDAHWPRSDAQACLQYLKFVWDYLVSGAGLRLFRHAKQILPMVLAPLVGLVLMAVLSIGFGAWVASQADSLASFAWLDLGKLSGLGAGVLSGLIVWLVMAHWVRKQRLFWLARGWVFMRKMALGHDERIPARFKELAEKVKAQLLETEADEYLLIGHCAGCVAAVSVLSHLQTAPDADDGNAALSKRMQRLKLLTLAQLINMLTVMSQARQFRTQMLQVATGFVPWYDLVSPTDSLCCGLVGPLAGVLAENDLGAKAVNPPWTRSARFDRMWSAERYKAIRRHAFLIHFQYLMATEQPVFNDYFSLTAGPEALHVRWGRPA